MIFLTFTALYINIRPQNTSTSTRPFTPYEPSIQLGNRLADLVRCHQ
jgi:hypothetical protein